MLQDINDEPKILNKLAEIYLPEGKPVQNINIAAEALTISKIFLVASGSSRNAANITRYFIEAVSKIPVSVEYASEFAEKNPILSANDLVIFVSQSGETSDVLAALKIAKSKGAHTFAITNNETSTIHITADSAMFIHAGKEISIPATKSFVAQLLCLYITGIYLAEKRNTLTSGNIEFYKKQIYEMPVKIEKLIASTEKIDKIAEKLHKSKSLIILGRGENFGLAEECALKIKETCYINTGSYPTGEFLHGHLAMLDETSPVISIITKYNDIELDSNYALAINNTIQLIKKRDAKVFIVKDESDNHINSLFAEYNSEYIPIAEFDEQFSPVYTAVVLHLLAYTMAELLGHDVNNPRSLSKTVSNENS